MKKATRAEATVRAAELGPSLGMRLARELGARSGEWEAGKKRAGSRNCCKKSRNR
jgi:hypothetical protein